MQVIDKATAILEILSEEESLTVSEIAERINLPIPTAYRILTALVKPGLLEKDVKTKGYHLGWNLLYLGARAQALCNQNYYLSAMHPFLETISRETGETCTLGALAGNRVICLDKIDGSGLIRIISQVGRELPWNAAAPAKAILAWQKPKHREALLKGKEFIRYTDRTITDLDTYLAELEQVKKDGYALCVDEMEVGHLAIAAPVFDRANHVSISLSILGPTQRMTENMDVNRQIILQTAARASAAIKTLPF